MVQQRDPGRIIVLEPDKTRLERGECPSCALPKKEWTRSTRWRCCSTKCTQAHRDQVIYGWNDLRARILKRRGQRCEHCGSGGNYRTMTVPTETTRAVGKQIRRWPGFRKWLRPGRILLRDKNFDVDHIRPIALGGDEYDEENLQVLCRDCHKQKTAVDAKDIAARRREERMEAAGQTTLIK